MATKNIKRTGKASKDSNTVHVTVKAGEDEAEAIAKAIIEPEVQAAVTIQQWESTGDLRAIMKELEHQIQAVNNGNMQRAEAILVTQAHTLNDLFNILARKAHGQEYLKSYEAFLKLALKAQSQCRITLETLSNIKNPPVVYAKQANISNGPQQVNNGVSAPHAEEIKNQPNELLEVKHGSETVDSRATIAAICQDQAMAALE